MTFAERKREILARVGRGEKVTVDANVIVNAATMKDRDFLTKLEESPLAEVNNVTYQEIKGLVNKKALDVETKDGLKLFADRIKDKVIKIHATEIEERLRPLTPLLPRSVANFVIVNFAEALLKKFEQLKARARTLSTADFLSLQKQFESSFDILSTKSEERYLELIDKLGIEEFDEDLYFSDVRKFVNAAKSEIDKVVQEAKGDVNSIIAKLTEFKRKTYDGDIKFCAETIARGATGISDDSDVQWLFTFHALRRAA